VQRKEREERFEREKIQFHHRVRRGYLSLAKKEPHRVKVIDTRQGEDKTFEKIRQIIDKLVGFKGPRVRGVK
jgi:dTMP kinase